MVDLLGDHALHSDRWAEVEQLVTAMALHHDLQVKAVYWRLMMSAPADAQAATAATAATPAVPLARVVAAPTVTAVSAAALAPGKSAFDPILNDEVLAFKRAIADAMPDQDASAHSTGEVVSSGPRHPEPPTPAYQDTQLLEPEDAGSPLSRTQFGGL
jgi:hypothetical protein